MEIENSNEYSKFTRFSEVYETIKNKPDEYKEAYNMAVEFAKEKVNNSKLDIITNQESLLTKLDEQYPNLDLNFKNCLVECADKYNPPVNVPEELLW